MPRQLFLAHPGKMWEASIVLDDPLVHVIGHGACTPAVSTALDLALEIHALLLKLESRLLKVLVALPHLRHPHAREGPCLLPDLVVEVIWRGSPSLVDAFDVSLGGTYHKTFLRGVMAPPARVRVGE